MGRYLICHSVSRSPKLYCTPGKKYQIGKKNCRLQVLMKILNFVCLLFDYLKDGALFKTSQELLGHYIFGQTLYFGQTIIY